jgi:hypothetical protein
MTVYVVGESFFICANDELQMIIRCPSLRRAYSERDRPTMQRELSPRVFGSADLTTHGSIVEITA